MLHQKQHLAAHLHNLAVVFDFYILMEEVVPGPHLNYEMLIWSHLDEKKGDFVVC